MRLIKYLYGKLEYLSPFINGEVSLRFSDLSHYSRLENELMRDDELNKKFELNPMPSTIKINNHVINSADVDGNISLSLPVSNCYCLCLSNRKNDVELFEKFKADVCLEIDVIELVNFLKAALQNFPGIVIEHRQVHYYEPTDPIPTTDRFELAFHKPNFFKHESEHRVVIRFPEEKRAFKTTEGLTIPIFIEGESMHLTINTPSPSFNQRYLRGTHHNNSVADA